jgi:hypothetical protein
MPIRSSNQNFNFPFKIYSPRDYAELYNELTAYDWSSVYDGKSIDAAVDRLNIAATLAIDFYITSRSFKRLNILTDFWQIETLY